MDVLGLLRPWIPALGTLAGAIALLLSVHVAFARRQDRARFTAQVVLLVLTLVALVAVIAVLPIKESLRGELLSLLGILLSAAIALSSTTFVGNAMAGLMLRSLRNFRPGDFLRVGDQLGRVTERGLFHTEIQTEDSDLTTFPNLFLVTNPVTVVRATGTIVSATVSLGYDVPRQQAQDALLRAAAAVDLGDGFVQVTELGDFSITYRVAGLLREVTTLLSTRAHLRAAMLDELHRAEIEIVSPNYMNTRALPTPETPPKPELPVAIPAPAAPSQAPEAIVFDKAEEAASVERLREQAEETEAKLVENKEELKRSGESGRATLEAQRATLEARLATLSDRIRELEAATDT